MLNKIKNCIIMVVIMSLARCYLTMDTVNSATLSIDDIITGIKYNQSIVKDAEVRYTLDAAMSNGKIAHHDFTDIYKGLKLSRTYTTIISGISQKVIKEVFNGETTIVWSGASFDSAGGGDIMSGDNISPYFSPREIGYEVMIGENRVPISEIVSNGTFKLEGEALVNGHNCNVITGIAANTALKFYIDTTRGFSILKIERKGTVDDEIELKEMPGNIWFPVKGTRYIAAPHPAAGSVLRLNVVDVKINQGISDDVFTINWKSGAVVYDAITGISYDVP